MNPEKSEMKLTVLQIHGEKTELKMEQCRLETVAGEAAVQVLGLTSKEFHKYMGEIELDSRTGKLTPAQAIVAKKYVQRCVDMIDGFLRGAEIKVHLTKGKMEAYKDVVECLKADRDEENKKLSGFREAQERASELHEDRDLETSEDVDISDLDPDRPRRRHPMRLDVARSLGIDTKKRK